MKPCHYIKHKGERILIPGCMGGAEYGMSHCHCDREKYKKDKLTELEERIKKLENKLR